MSGVGKQPQIFWVVADRTNAGKTTIASALIRVLNDRGIPALGFKPYGGICVRESFDLIWETYRKGGPLLYGGDTLRLAQASPLTTADMVEVVGPSYRLSYPFVQGVVLGRKGSALLGDREFFKTTSAEAFHKRPDIERLEERTGLPFRDARTMANIHPRSMDLLLPERITAAFDYLKARGPRAIVCEGASNYLPFWHGQPRVDHVFRIAGDVLRFFPNLGFDLVPRRPLAERFRRERVPKTKAIGAQLSTLGARAVEQRLQLAESGRRDAWAEQVVVRLLDRGGIC